MDDIRKYPIAKKGIFWSIQGEGHLRGFQMAFLRLAGCSVGCPQCDTDYSLWKRMDLAEIECRLSEVVPSCKDQWVWITGGEPTDHDLVPLFGVIRNLGFSLAVATSGKARCIPPVDWLSVSYHGGYPLMQKYGNEIKIVPGLNGLNPWKFQEDYPDNITEFLYRYVQPLTVNGKDDPKSLRDCLRFLKENPGWGLSRQDHHHWGVQ